ncbi:MAG: hypothetical protein HPY52_10920 [Firmicutes bacterium]|nr:hypothetical protein [Bacillota bacterium]
MLVEKFKGMLGKSAHGGQTLYDHSMASARIACRVLTDSRFAPDWFPSQKRDQILFAIFMHDVGKLDPAFGAMLEAARSGQPLPSKRVKHEASTLDFESLIIETEEEVKDHLRAIFGYRFTSTIDLNEVFAFAVTHHGLFYISFEKRDDQIVRRIRREWTVFNYGEVARITLADLLFDYHPMGGLVMISDLLASFCHERQIDDADEIINKAHSLRELVDLLLREGADQVVERSIQEYEPRTGGLHDILTLLAGGLT